MCLSASANIDFLLTCFLLRDHTGSLQISRLTFVEPGSQEEADDSGEETCGSHMALRPGTKVCSVQL